MFTPIESSEYPGFFLTAMSPDVAVSKEGEVVRLSSPIRKFIGSKTFGSNTSGYRVVTCFNNESGRREPTRVHRLSAYAFYGPPPEEGLEVNHKDGSRDNNHWENLEWTTHQGNMKHAFSELDNSKVLVPIKVKDLKIGSVTYFDSMTDADRALGFRCGTIGSRRYSKDMPEWFIARRYLVKLADDDTPWRDLRFGESVRTLNVLAYEWRTDNIYIYRSREEAADKVGIGFDALASYLTARRKHILNGFVFSYMTDRDKLPTRVEVAQACEDYKSHRADRKIYVEPIDGNKGRWMSFVEAAHYFGVVPCTLKVCGINVRKSKSYKGHRLYELWDFLDIEVLKCL